MVGESGDHKLLFSVTLDDCEVQTFRSGGKGGQHQNKTDSGVRIIHHPSGARGESREERSQLQNKRAAFVRMANTPAFKYWVSVQTGQRKSEEQLLIEINQELNDPTKTVVEVRTPQGWQSVPS